MMLIPRPRPHPRTESAAHFWSTWGQFFKHGSECPPCRAGKPCPVGARLEEIHTAARKHMHADAASPIPPCR